MFKRLALPALALTSTLFLGGCTGDPHKGGIFWSEDKAQDRLRDRRAHLNDVEDDTAQTNRRNRRLEGAAARREQMLGQ